MRNVPGYVAYKGYWARNYIKPREAAELNEKGAKWKKNKQKN